jgi:hypothetical protein
MSADRLERRLPEVLTELSLPVMPDYIDSLLSRTERMSQRPRWSLPERWIPVSTFEATLAGRRPASLRPMIVLAIVAALIAASLVWYVGSQRHDPPPFGLARNGVIVTNNVGGDIVSIDPQTGDVRTLVAGPNLCCPAFSPNGRVFDYLRVPVDGADPTALVIANADGTTIREVPAERLRGLGYGEWSPSSEKDLLVTSAGVIVVDVATGTITPVTAPFQVTKASWIGMTGDLLLSNVVNPDTPDNLVRFARLNAGADAPTELATLPYAVFEPEMSPDGTKFLYFIWGPEDRLHGRIHVYDLATNEDFPVTSELATDELHSVEDPHWSPDGSLIVAVWMYADGDQLGIIPAMGGDTVFVGPRIQEGFGEGSGFRFAPDGESILVHYGIDNSTWLLPVNGDPGHEVAWTVTNEWGWQRLAP